MLRALILIFISICLIQSQALVTNHCVEVLSESRHPERIDRTNGLIAYLSDLLQERIIDDPELLRWIASLEKGELINPISEEQIAIKSTMMIHGDAIQDYITHTELDQKRLLEWAESSLKENKRVHKKREETKEVTRDIHQKMEFNPVPAGSFKMGGGKLPVTLTHPFEMMSTAVTQKMWVEEMGENPSKFIVGDRTEVAVVKGKQIKMQSDNPVEMVNWWSAIEYANRMSIKAGLKPAYDLSGIKFKLGTSAEAGNLEPEDGDTGELKINAPDEDIYQAEGYRLPTEAEFEYVLRAAGKANGKYHFGDDDKELKDHAWYDANSDKKTHLVAQLNPLTINGKDFYDLFGNVWEWNYDWYGDLKAGNNPQGPKKASDRVLRGGGWIYGADWLQSTVRYGWGPAKSDDDVGFRLVRTLK